MACKRSAVRSRLPPPPKSPSSRGLGHDPFTVVTGVRIPLGTPTRPYSRGSLGWRAIGQGSWIACALKAELAFTHPLHDRRIAMREEAALASFKCRD